MTITLVPTATAAFIADLTSTQMHRIVDDDVLGEPLVACSGGRAFALLTSALAKFYFDTAMEITRDARIRHIGSMVERVSSRRDAERIFSLQGEWTDMDWTIRSRGLCIQLGDYVAEAQRRARLVARAEASIQVSPEVMSAEPVYTGTRVPIANVLASKRAGFDLDELQEAYAFLTPELVEDAETYQTIHPKVGRPHMESGGEPRQRRRKLVSSEVVALPARQS